jgi:hypothetical protein
MLFSLLSVRVPPPDCAALVEGYCSVVPSGLGVSSHVIPARACAAAWDLWLRHGIGNVFDFEHIGTSFFAGAKIRKKYHAQLRL